MSKFLIYAKAIAVPTVITLACIGLIKVGEVLGW